MTTLNYAASHQTVRISSKRYERSPYADKFETDDAVFGVYARRFYPLTLGEDPIEMYWRLRREAVMFDVPERPIEIKGPDAVKLLERVFTRVIATLNAGRARYAIACAPTGGIVMDGVLMRLAEDHFWYVQADGEFTMWLMAHSADLNVEISDPRSWVLQIQGPNSFDILHAATHGALDESFGYFHSGMFDMGGQQVLVSRTGWTGELGFEIYSQGTGTDCPALWDHLMLHGEPHGMVFSSLETMGIRRLEAGILDNGTDMDVTMTPYEVGLGTFVDPGKSEFVGRGALLKADQRPLLYGLICESDVPFADLEVLDENTVVGRMKSGAWSPYLERGIGYVCFRHAGDWLGQSLSLRTREGSVAPCKIVTLPFYDAEKRIPRGLDREIPEAQQ